MKKAFMLGFIMLGILMVQGGANAGAKDGIVSCDDLLNKLAPHSSQTDTGQKVRFRGLTLSGSDSVKSESDSGVKSPPAQPLAQSSSPQPPLPVPEVPKSVEAEAPSVDIYIYFKSGTSQIADARSWRQLDEVGKALSSQSMSGCTIEIGGHTDSRGDPGYNMHLSRDRANMVRQYLKSKYRLPRMQIKGYGESQPVASNDTEAGRALNRRVAITRLN